MRPPDIGAAAQRLDAVGIGDAVVDPVGRGKLVVPDAFVGEKERFDLGHGLLPVREGLDQALAPRSGAAVCRTLLMLPVRRGGGELAWLAAAPGKPRGPYRCSSGF